MIAHPQFIALALAAVATTLVEASPLRPRATAGDFAFFEPPMDFASRPIGGILRTRQLPNVDGLNFTAPIHAAYQILYKSWDPVNKMSLSTPATVIVPQGNKAALIAPPPAPEDKTVGRNNILVFNTPYDSSYKGCGPSYRLINDSNADPTTNELPLINQALSQNLTVMLPDYEGPLGGFNTGPLEGNGVLGAVSAVLSFRDVVPQRHTTQFVLQGYSGGAIATGWALQQSFTSNFLTNLQSHIVGAVIGGLPTNATRDLLQLNGAIGSGLVVASLAGQYNVYAESRKFFDKHLNQAGRDAFAFSNGNCLSATSSKYPFTEFFSTFTDLTLEQALADPGLADVRRRLNLASPAAVQTGKIVPPTIPTFLYSSTKDETVPHQDTLDYYNAVCSGTPEETAKLSVQLLNVVAPTHAATEGFIAPRQGIQYVLDRFNGVPVPSGCSTSSFTVPSPSPSATS